jgi:hypothetical protein
MNSKQEIFVMRIFIAVLFLSLPLFSQDTEKKEPTALTKAREGYQVEVARVLMPVTKTYLDRLEALKKDLGAKGKIEEAMAVQQEIEQVTPRPVSKDPAIVGIWTFGPYGTAQFNADGTSRIEKVPGRWVKGKKSGTYRVTWDSGYSNDLVTVTKDKFKTIDSTGKEIFIIRQ